MCFLGFPTLLGQMAVQGADSLLDKLFWYGKVCNLSKCSSGLQGPRVSDDRPGEMGLSCVPLLQLDRIQKPESANHQPSL